jgi:hypothetical protein
MKTQDEFRDPMVEKHLASLRPTPQRDAAVAAHGREQFLLQAEEMALPVSPAQKMRHTGWKQFLTNLFSPRKERVKMITIINFLVAFMLVCGGSGLTAVAAEGSLPDSPLYAVKLFTEDIRLALTTESQTRLELNLEFANRRTEEIQLMVQAGKIPPDSVPDRLQLHLNNSLQLAAGMDDEHMAQALNQIRQEIQSQMEQMQQIQANASVDAAQLLTRTRDMLQDRLRLTEQGLSDPDQLRLQIQEQLQEQDRLRTSQPTDAGNPDQTPGGSGPGPNSSSTPEPGGNGGPNPEPCTTCTPQGGGGPGPNPSSTCTPQSGGGGGPNPQPCTTCTPQGSGGGGGNR